MKTIWVVEQGVYSDYRVVGVFSRKENAEQIKDKINATESYEEATVAEWPLDPLVEELRKGYTPWNGEMLRDGTVERMQASEFCSSDVGSKLRIWERSQAPYYRGTGTPDCLSGTVWAKDVKHAVKIFNEQRTQLIALGEWKEV